MPISADHLLLSHGLFVVGIVLAGGVLAYWAQRLALFLMFHPIDFKGWKSRHADLLGLHAVGIQGLGWQGLVPQQAQQMAEVSVRIMTHRLLPLVDIIRRIQPDALVKSIRPGMEDTAEEAMREALQIHKPRLWESLPAIIQARIIDRGRDQVLGVATEIVRNICKYPEKFLDLRALVVQVLVQKPQLLIDLFKRAGKDPIQFLTRFALPAGLFSGLAVSVVTVFTQGNVWWVLAVGVGAGAFSKWLAMQSLFFHPQQNHGWLGAYEGYFFRAQSHIAATYAEVVAEQIVTPEHIVSGLTNGPNSPRLISMMHHHIQRALDEGSSSVKPLLVMFVGANEWQKIRQHISQSFVDRLEEHMRASQGYLADTLEIRATVESRLSTLSAVEFERILRPVFQNHEWMLTVVGSIWGILLGAFAYMSYHF